MLLFRPRRHLFALAFVLAVAASSVSAQTVALTTVAAAGDLPKISEPGESVAPPSETTRIPVPPLDPALSFSRLLKGETNLGRDDNEDHPNGLGSTYISLDSPVYEMGMRLYALGYLDRAFIGLRPWTRRSLLHMVEESTQKIMLSGNEEAVEILARLNDELLAETPLDGSSRGRVTGVESTYTRLMGIKGQTLRDSFHLGQTIVNDYGRPYEPGFNNLTGFSTVNEWGRFSLYARGEYEHAPSNAGYSLALASTLSCIDQICPFTPPNQPQATIPYGPINAQNPFRLQEAALSLHLLGHELSGGKTDAWVGPGMGGAMAWSNNAENIYSFRINRVEPMTIPLLSRVLGPVRYDFFVGSLKGHTYPNAPWVHQEAFSFRPSRDFEFGFQRTVIWGGKNHAPINLHTFLISFFSFDDTTAATKFSASDPGARFTAFNFSWRLPYIRRYVTLYTDSESHDDVTPLSAPRRGAYRPGIVISQLPKLPRLELRVEAADTDPPVLPSMSGNFNYFETVQHQGYTNKGFIFGDWIGREAKGGQAWLTYHLSGNEWVQLEYLNKKTPKDFIPGGTTQNQFKVEVVKRLRKDIELNAWVQWEHWKAPIYMIGAHDNAIVAGQITFYPKLKTSSSHP